MKLIGLCGHAGAGKNTFAEEFHYHGYLEYAFADPVKKVCKEVFGFTDTDFTDRDKKELANPYWNISPRTAAQIVGTELFRDNFSTDIWIKSLEYRLIKQFKDQDSVKVIVTDVRFQDEADWILNLGGKIVHLTRPGFDGNVGVPNHRSEAGINLNKLISIYGESKIHEITNSGTLDDLKIKAHTFIKLELE